MMEKCELYLEKMNAQIEQYSAKIAGIQSKAAEVHVDMKLEYLNKVKKIEGKRDGLKKKYEKLSKASEGSRIDIKEGTQNAWNEIKESFDKTKKEFK
jgi:DNA phosphorothioation-dependent restriction protein DptG